MDHQQHMGERKRAGKDKTSNLVVSSHQELRRTDPNEAIKYGGTALRNDSRQVDPNLGRDYAVFAQLMADLDQEVGHFLDNMDSVVTSIPKMDGQATLWEQASIPQESSTRPSHQLSEVVKKARMADEMVQGDAIEVSDDCLVFL